MLRDTAIGLFETAVAAADPRRAVRTYLPGNLPEPDQDGKLAIIALGKAAGAMMQETLDHLPPRLAFEGLVVTNAENAAHLPSAVSQACTLVVGGHPVPDEGSLQAGDAILKLARGLGEKDRLLALISGGGSALAIAPIEGLDLADKRAVNQVLLGAGLDINAMNEVRQALSALKGGGLARAAYPAKASALILSDVVGDDLAAVASGPTVAPIGNRASALKILRDAGVLEDCPPAVVAALRAGEQSQKVPSCENTLIGSNAQSVRSAASALDGIDRIDLPIVGDVADAAQALVDHATRDFVAGGETTVILKGTGKGGRNQELALRFAMLAGDQIDGEWVFLSGGTDGRDGPTDAAGGIVDANTVALIDMAGMDLDALLDNNDAYRALDAAGALLKVPPTGTNVADIHIFLRKD